MTNFKKRVIYNFIKENRILVLLSTILILLFAPPFINSDSVFFNLFLKFDFLLIILSCYFIVHKIKISNYIGIATFLAITIDIFLPNDFLDYASQIGVSILIIHAFVFVLREAISPRGNSKNLILVSITGYFILGLIGGFLTALLQFIIPNSFIHTTGIQLELSHMIYYSYVTMTTLGYGDIIPVTEKSQALALFLAIVGQLFLTVIMAINIAKIMQKSLLK